MIAQHRRQHDAMLALAETILALAAGRDVNRMGELSMSRLAFSRTVSEHCEQEGATFREARAQGKVCASLVAEFAKIVMMWRADLAQCNSEWPAKRVQEDPNGFIRTFRPLVTAMKRQSEREDVEILAVLDRSNTRSAKAL
jgi:hypothetical protein